MRGQLRRAPPGPGYRGAAPSPTASALASPLRDRRIGRARSDGAEPLRRTRSDRYPDAAAARRRSAQSACASAATASLDDGRRARLPATASPRGKAPERPASIPATRAPATRPRLATANARPPMANGCPARRRSQPLPRPTPRRARPARPRRQTIATPGASAAKSRRARRTPADRGRTQANPVARAQRSTPASCRCARRLPCRRRIRSLRSASMPGAFLLRPAIELDRRLRHQSGAQRRPASRPGTRCVAPELLVNSNWSRHELTANLRGSYTDYENALGSQPAEPRRQGQRPHRRHAAARASISKAAISSAPTIPAARTSRPISRGCRSTPRSAAPPASASASTVSR